MTESFSVERRKILRALGAKVVLTPAAARGTGMVKKGNCCFSLSKSSDSFTAAELSEKHGWFMTSQFRNPANVQCEGGLIGLFHSVLLFAFRSCSNDGERDSAGLCRAQA